MHVIVADNDEEICEFIRDFLQEGGIDAIAVTSCQAASQLMLTGNWNILLTDLLFSIEQTGLDLAAEAVALGIHSVIMSGALERREEIEACGVRFLAKPFSCAQLLAALTFKRRGGPAQLAA